MEMLVRGQLSGVRSGTVSSRMSRDTVAVDLQTLEREECWRWPASTLVRYKRNDGKDGLNGSWNAHNTDATWLPFHDFFFGAREEP